VKIATYNAASVRARLPRLIEWIDANEPDVLAIQETKVENHLFPREEFESRGYQLALNGQKSWNGVCLLSKRPLTNVRTHFDDPFMPQDARVISANVDGIEIVNTYVPNGNTVGSEKWTYKLAWLDHFSEFVRERYTADAPLLWLGDINIAPKANDVYDSQKVFRGVGHHPDEFARLDRILDFGLADLYRQFYPDVRQYTYWDFTVPNAVGRGQGWRIDHIYASEPIANLCSDVAIDVEARLKEKPSDHTFVLATFDL
jgi:exodeoxyribonuclease-3